MIGVLRVDGWQWKLTWVMRESSASGHILRTPHAGMTERPLAGFATTLNRVTLSGWVSRFQSQIAISTRSRLGSRRRFIAVTARLHRRGTLLLSGVISSGSDGLEQRRKAHSQFRHKGLNGAGRPSVMNYALSAYLESDNPRVDQHSTRSSPLAIHRPVSKPYFNFVKGMVMG